MDIFTNLSLFSGAGGLDLGAKIAEGFRTVCYVESDAYAQAVLQSRMRDGGLDEAPIWDDVKTFDGRPWRGVVDILSGGFPCQDLSHAGRRAGIHKGARSGLWFEFARIIREVGPACVLVENVPGLVTSGGLGAVLGSLAALGYDAVWWSLSAAAVGAPHLRERVWIVGYRAKLGGVVADADVGRRASGKRIRAGRYAAWNGGELVADAARLLERWALEWAERQRARTRGQSMADSPRVGRQRRGAAQPDEVAEPSNAGRKVPDAALKRPLRRRRRVQGDQYDERRGPDQRIREIGNERWWFSEPALGRVAHGVAYRVDSLRCVGNGVVPLQGAFAWWVAKKILGEI